MHLENAVDPVVLAAAALLVAGVLAAAFATRLRLPALLLFLGVGMVIGDDGFNLISLANPSVAQTAGILALIVILFEGGLTTPRADLRRAGLAGMGLATVGVALTAGTVALAVLVVTDLEPMTAALIGAVVSSTDAAAVFSMLRRFPLPRRITSVLRIESGANDPMAVLLTIGLLEAWRYDPDLADWLTFGVVQLGGGAVAGVVVGAAAAWILSRVNLGSAGMYPVMALGFGAMAYGAAAVTGASGFLAVYICGVLTGAWVPRHRRGIRNFHEALANVAEIGLFLLLGLLVFPSQLPALVWPALAVSAVLVLIARPLAVHATMVVPLLRGRWRMSELAVLSWAGLRGAVPIVLATFPLTAGYPEGGAIFNMVFFVVLVSTALQGSTIGFFSRRIAHLRQPADPIAPIAEVLPLEGAEIDMVELELRDGMAVVGRTLREARMPDGSRVAALVRAGGTQVPHGDTVLRAGDRLVVTARRDPRSAALLTDWASGEPAEAPRDAGEPG